MSPSETVYISANGIDFCCNKVGSGNKHALLLHGFPDNRHTFDRLAGYLAAIGYTCWAPNMRGYAPTSSPANGDYQIIQLAQDAVGLATRIGDGSPVDIVGHDWGAAAMYAACALEPGRFRRAVGLALPPAQYFANSIASIPGQARRSWYIGFFQLPAVPEMMVKRRGLAFVDWIWSKWSPGWTAPAEHLASVRETLSTGRSLSAALAYYRGALRGSARHPSSFRATSALLLRNKIDVPTLIIGGKSDGCVDPRSINRGVRAFTMPPRVHLIDNCGHFPHLEFPDLVNDLIADHLQMDIAHVD